MKGMNCEYEETENDEIANTKYPIYYKGYYDYL